jgi:hypothetical protein
MNFTQSSAELGRAIELPIPGRPTKVTTR